MNILAEITKKHLKKNVPDLLIGDTVKVHQRIRDIDAKGKERERIQVYEGIVIARKHGVGVEATFTVRKIGAAGVGVERVFPLHSPNIVKIERTKSAKVRQSKLYYLRDLRSTQMRLRKETQHKTTWEEKGAEAEIEALKEETAQAASEAAEEKAEAEEVVTEAPEAPENPAEIAESKEESVEKTDEAKPETQEKSE